MSSDTRPRSRSVSTHPIAARVSAFALAMVAAGTLLTGCSSEGADVDCSLNACTVTFDRGVDAKASVLGVDVKLENVQNGQVTLDVEGNQVQVPVGGEADAQAGGLRIRVDSVTDDKVVVKISNDGG